LISVVKKGNYDPDKYDEIYLIDRSTPLGNPHTSKDLDKTMAKYQASSRSDSIEKFESWLLAMLDYDNATSQLFNTIRESYISKNKNIALVCHCKPKPCHGDVIKRLIVSPTLW